MTMLFRYTSKFDLTPEALTEIVVELSRRLTPRVHSAYLFGSCATGRFRRDSDIDLIIVVESSEKFSKRSPAFADLLEVYPAMDILVYTPHEFARARLDAGFLHGETLRRICGEDLGPAAGHGL